MTPKDIAVIITAIGVPCLMFLAGGIYHICEYIKSKRPHKSDDEEDNPIVKFKDDLAEIYESNPNGKLKKLAQAVWNRVVEIEKWHNAEIHDWERKYYSSEWEVGQLNVKCERYSKELDDWVGRCKELKSKLAESEKCLNHSWEREANLRKANEGLNKLLKEEQEKNKIPIFSDQTEVPVYLISENTFGSQINPFSKITLNKEPLTATEATELAERLQNMTSQPIVLDSETLNCCNWERDENGVLQPSDIICEGKEKDEPQTKNEEFIKQLRDWWGLEAQKAVELPNTDKKGEHRLTAEELRWKYLWTLLYSIPEGAHVKRFKVRVVGTYNNGRDMIHTDWELPGTSINEIIDVLGKDGLRIIGGEELPV